MVELTREEYNLIAEHRGIKKPQNMSTKKLINTLNRYANKRKGEKLSKIGLGKIAKIPNISENEVNQAELIKEGLITSLLKSESSNAERNYMKHFNNNNDDDDDTYDGKIRGKISDIRMMLSK